jgi:hypothetical protein
MKLKSALKNKTNYESDFTDFFESNILKNFSDKEIYCLMQDRILSIEELSYLNEEENLDE